jgi:hypothetical protein
MALKEAALFRFSLAKLLWLVALAALNFAVLRSFRSIAASPEPIVLLVALMPLFDGFVISLYAAAARKYHFALKRRDERCGFGETFALTTGLMLVVSMFLCFAAPQHLLGLIDALLGPFSQWFGDLSRLDPAESLLGAALCLIVSGPPLVIAVVFALVMSRYKLEIVRRE